MVNFDATLLAQVVNFIVLLVILGKFAYKPLMRVLDERRERIANDLDSAEKTRNEAAALKEDYSKKLAEARSEAAAIVAKAEKAADKVHSDSIAEAQAEKEQMIKAAKQTIEQEKQQAMAEIRTQVIVLATEIAGKVVAEKLNSDDDKKLIEKTADSVMK